MKKRHQFIMGLKVGDKFSLSLEDQPAWEIIKKFTGTEPELTQQEKLIAKRSNLFNVKHLVTGKEERFYPSTEGLDSIAPQWLVDSSLKCWVFE